MKDTIIHYFQNNTWATPGEMDFSTLQLGKERHTAKYKVISLKLSDQKGQRWQFCCFLAQNESGLWEVQGLNGFEEDPAEKFTNRANLPLVDLNAASVDDAFFASGTIEKHNSTITRLRLRWLGGTEIVVKNGKLSDLQFLPHKGYVLEDTIEGNVVLFVIEQQLGRPDLIEFCDDSENVIASQSWYGGYSS